MGGGDVKEGATNDVERNEHGAEAEAETAVQRRGNGGTSEEEVGEREGRHER